MSGSSAAIKRYHYLLGEMEAVYHRLSYRLGMSDSVSKLLYTICDEGGQCPLHLICLRTGLSKQTVNSALRKLEQEGLVRLEASGGRGKTICLTREGDRFSEHTARRIIRLENQVLDSWTEDEVRQYLDLTERFLKDRREKAHELERER